MRLYELNSRPATSQAPPAVTAPGFRLTEVIDQFYAEGVVPEFLPADLGTDEANELDADGNFSVDPNGRIDVDPMDRLEQQLMEGIKDLDVTKIPDAVPPAPAPDDPPANE